MPGPQGISIKDCARMSLMLRRAPVPEYTTEYWKDVMRKIPDCTGCGSCKKKCPYGLDIPELLKENYEDYKRFL